MAEQIFFGADDAEQIRRRGRTASDLSVDFEHDQDEVDIAGGDIFFDDMPTHKSKTTSNRRDEEVEEEDGDDTTDDVGNDDDSGFTGSADDDYVPDNKTPARRRKAQPAFYKRSVQAAERSALRVQYDKGEQFLLKEEQPPLLKNTPTRDPLTFERLKSRNGIRGKKVTAELDEDDELMLTMREKGYNDQQIADRLAKDGRAKYDRKSISARITRIRLAQAKHVDMMLEEGYKEWEYEDDQLLMDAFGRADIEINYEIERARACRWRKVADFMRRQNKDAIFSEDAVRERYIALMNGTAAIPSEMDDDPIARRMEMEAAREQREVVREAERQQQEKDAAELKRIREETRMRQAVKYEESARAREEKAQRQAEKSAQRAAELQMKAERAKQQAEARKRDAEQAKKKRVDEQVAKREEVRRSNPNTPLAMEKLASVTEIITSGPDDPRNRLTKEQLKALCASRGLATGGRSADEYLKRLQDADDKFTAVQLKNMCRVKGLNHSGTKPILKYQLAAAEARIYSASAEANSED